MNQKARGAHIHFNHTKQETLRIPFVLHGDAFTHVPTNSFNLTEVESTCLFAGFLSVVERGTISVVFLFLFLQKRTAQSNSSCCEKEVTRIGCPCSVEESDSEVSVSIFPFALVRLPALCFFVFLFLWAADCGVSACHMSVCDD